MRTNFQRLHSGQPLSFNETTANAIIASAENWAKHARDPGNVPAPEYQFAGTIIQVRNDSGGVMPRFSVAGFSAALILPADNLGEFQNYPRFSVDVPSLPDDAGRFCILVEPLAAGAIGLALVTGVAPVQINLAPGADAPDFADAVNGQIGYLQPAASGAQVLYCDPAPTFSPAPVWALVRIPSGGAGTLTAFELYDDFAPGDTNKYVWTLNDDYTRNTSAGQATVQVSDEVLGDVLAYGSNHSGWSSTRGALGFYAAGTDGKNQIVSIRRLAKMIKIITPTGSGGFAANGTISGITSVTVLDDGQNPLGDASSISVTNWNLPICNDVTATCLADGSGGYYVIDADCPPSGGCT